MYLVGQAQARVCFWISFWTKKKDTHRETKNKRVAINLTSDDKFLVLQEFGAKEQEVLSSKELMKGCDVMCLIYDVSDPQSFEHCNKIISRSSKMPFIIVANKIDLQEQPQTVSPIDVCKELGIAAPLRVSLKNDNTEVFSKIVKAAIKPHEAVPASSSLRKHKDYSWWKVIPLVVPALGLLYYGYQFYKKKDTTNKI